MKTQIFLSSILLLAGQFNATASVVVDDHRVYNPESTKAIHSFDGLINTTSAQPEQYADQVDELETLVLNWIETNDQAAYIRDFDRENFYWQFINDGKGERIGHFGVILIIPENQIRKSFYEELGGGLMLSGKHLIDYNVHWTNDGEMFSFVINKHGRHIQHFKNWRFEYQVIPEFDRVYYSDLIINFNDRSAGEKLYVHQYVGTDFKKSIQISNGDTLSLPKGRLSTLVISDKKGTVRGIVCFNMKNIADMCPRPFETTLYLSEGQMNANKVLYAEPFCDDIFSYSFLEKDSFEDISQIYHWITATFFADGITG